MYSNKVKMMKSGLVNNSLSLYQQLLSDGYKEEESKTIIKEMHLDFLKTFSEDVSQKEISSYFKITRDSLYKKYKNDDLNEIERANIRKFIESYDDIKDLL